MKVSPSVYDDKLEEHFRVKKGLGLTGAADKNEYYGFSGIDVADVHYHKQGHGAGLFYRLRDGRVFDTAAREQDPDPLWYDQTTH